MDDLSASTAEGSKFATAVPEVVKTTEGLSEAIEIPRAWNPADLSSIELYIWNTPFLESSPAAMAKGADLLPGEIMTFSTPHSDK